MAKYSKHYTVGLYFAFKTYNSSIDHTVRVKQVIEFYKILPYVWRVEIQWFNFRPRWSYTIGNNV